MIGLLLLVAVVVFVVLLQRSCQKFKDEGGGELREFEHYLMQKYLDNHKGKP